MAFQTLIPFQPPVPLAHHVGIIPPCGPPPTVDSLGFLSKFQPPVTAPPRVERVHDCAPPWAAPINFPYTAPPANNLILSFRKFDYKAAQLITGLTIGPLTTPPAPAPVTVACSLTVADLRLKVQEKVDDPGIYYTPDECLFGLNFGQRLFCLLTRCLEKQAVFTLTNGTAYYDDIRAQITDFLLPLRVYYSGSRLIADTIHNLDLRDSTWRARAGDPKRYAVSGWKILAVTPQPASGSNILDFWYAAEPVDLVNETDTPQIAPEQQVHLPDFAAWFLRLKEGSIELKSAKKFLDRFLMAADKHGKFVASKSGGQTYDTPPFDLQTYERGRFEIALKQVPPPMPPKPGAKK